MAVTRRAFIVTGALAGGGLVLGYVLSPLSNLKRARSLGATGDEVMLATWVKIAPDSTVTVIVPHSEMGQGVHTSLPMMLAEELDDMGRDLKASVASHLNTIIRHLLKLQHSPAEWPRAGWQNSVRSARDAARRRMTGAIEKDMRQELPDLYKLARTMAEADLRRYREDRAAEALPEGCPYAFEDLLREEWWPARGEAAAG